MPHTQRYKVTEKIDSGGMAEIFRGYSFSLDGIQKQVAIKRVRPHLAENKKFIKMFIDEARLAMRLNHANIPQVFDVGRAQGTYFLVMEFVDGVNLRKLQQTAAEKGYRIPLEISIHIIIEVCKALAHAHEARDEEGRPLNIVHRDVSPPNIIISKSGEVKITDFGLAKAATQLESTGPGVIKGKFSYLSPEACEGKSVDPRADIFSCGTILHELLTGRRLFMGKTDLETVEQIRKCEVPAPSLLNPDVDRELDEVVLKALAKDRKRRYQSARDMCDALARYLFSRGLKVTTFDLAQMVESLFGDGEVQPAKTRVVDLVREEVLNLSSMGKLSGLTPTDGGAPLDISAFCNRKSAFEDIWQEYEESERSQEEQRFPILGTEEKQAGKGAAASSGAVSRAWLWILLIVVLGMVGGIAYVVLRTELLNDLLSKLLD